MYLHVPSAVHEAFAVVGIPTHLLFLITKEIRFLVMTNFKEIYRSMYKLFRELRIPIRMVISHQWHYSVSFELYFLQSLSHVS